MLKSAAFLVAFAMLGAVLGAQETKPEKPLDLLGDALQKTLDKGACQLQGKYERDAGVMDMAGGFMGGSSGKTLSGSFSMKIAKNGLTMVTLGSEDGRLEVYGQGVRRAQRLSWGAGRAPSAGNAHEILTLLSFARLKKALKEAKDVEVKEDESVRDDLCWVVSASLAKHLLDNDAEGANPVGQMVFELKSIKASFYVSKKDRVIQKIKVSVTRGMSDMVKSFLPEGGDKEPPAGDKKDDGAKKAKPAVPGLGDVDPETVKGAIDAMRTIDQYTLQVERFDPALSVEIPAELKSFFSGE